jgi:recombination protein RecA
MDFLKSVKKDLKKAGIRVGDEVSAPPRYWFSTGNYVLNKIISGSFYKGIPQGRIIAFSGPSQSGKSFLLGNVSREAQKEGAYVIIIDTESALDDEFISKIGVDVNDNYTYIAVGTIPDTIKVVSSIINGYIEEYADDIDSPKVLINIDSLDMLMTETEKTHFKKGDTTGDQGQRNKQLKAMLREFTQAIKHQNISMIVTSHVYRNQEIRSGEGLWIISEAIRFSLSQIVLITKLKLRERIDNKVKGIRMMCEGYKTRFTKPFQTVTIEVPYDTGMDPFNGLIEVAVELGVVHKKGSRYIMEDEEKSWLAKDVGDRLNTILERCEMKCEKVLIAKVDGEEIE